jgi:hypothetical protein
MNQMALHRVRIPIQQVLASEVVTVALETTTEQESVVKN